MTATGTNILEISELTKRYGSVSALNSVSLNIAEGEFVTLLGPSGSGKTTLLKIISGALTPSSGAVRLRGTDVTYLPARMRGIGMVFQNFALMPHLTIFENIAFPLRIRKVPRDEMRDRVAEALKLIQLSDIESRYPKELSGGQQQRVAIARALVYRPPLILMDEPLGALDKKLRHQMQFEIKRIHETLGLSMIYVTHDQEEALTMSDRICLMGGGEIQEVGAPRDIYAHPSSAFSADFFGGTNIFDGEISAQENVIQHEAFGAVKSTASFGAAGRRADWLVRPERIKLLSPEDREDNQVVGTVEQIVLTGQITHLIVSVAADHRLTVACLTDERVADLVEGASVRLGWNDSATIALRGR